MGFRLSAGGGPRRLGSRDPMFASLWAFGPQYLGFAEGAVSTSWWRTQTGLAPRHSRW